MLGLMSEKLDIGTAFDKLRDNLKCYMDRNIDNAKDVIYFVTYIDGTMKTFEEENIPKDLDEDEYKSILNNKIL